MLPTGAAAAIGEAKHRDRQADVGLDRLDQVADAAGLGGGGMHDPGAGLQQDGEFLDRLESGGEAGAGSGLAARPCAAAAAFDLAVALGLRGLHWRETSSTASSAAEDARFSPAIPKIKVI